ncbi:hypothetical protein QWY82_00755 [Simiduia curdlanivorans]|uniref:Uncharacterized protein n=1 Tax=Simiduia curdlanivorans TaxID=1492769 RepID=A0ABV8V453_9GAMM|nr:hypothetical protein [Simiduia curdlanivorans]MDN3637323.1 hypothetical protein [Simiduia curdlanivorans]
MWVKLTLIWLVAMAPLALAQHPTGCDVKREAPVAFVSQEVQDKLTVSVVGNPCSEATVTLRIKDKHDREVYLYEGILIDHLPFIIYEPDLQPLVTFFVEKVIRDGFIRTTADLPAWEPVEDYYDATNDIIIVPEAEYAALIRAKKPIFWHAAGDATWAHVVYDSATGYGRIIMRGGVFRPGAK